MNNPVKTILWDWNGTLLNDRKLCLESMNTLLANRNLPALSLEKYLKVFTFPVREYYNVLGFDFTQEAFEIPAEQFVDLYNSSLQHVPLFDDAVDALEYFKNTGCRQYIVSAMEQKALLESVNHLGISKYFIDIKGINDNLAHGKTMIAQQLFHQYQIDSHSTLLIGDTLHDAEIAKMLGIKNILISRGHQCITRITQTGNLVFGSLSEMIDQLSKINPAATINGTAL